MSTDINKKTNYLFIVIKAFSLKFEMANDLVFRGTFYGRIKPKLSCTIEEYKAYVLHFIAVLIRLK